MQNEPRLASIRVSSSGSIYGDGKADMALYRPSNQTWYIYQNSTSSLRTESFGSSGDNPATRFYTHGYERCGAN